MGLGAMDLRWTPTVRVTKGQSRFIGLFRKELIAHPVCAISVKLDAEAVIDEARRDMHGRRVYAFQSSPRVYIMIHRFVWKMHYPLRWSAEVNAEVDHSLHLYSL